MTAEDVAEKVKEEEIVVFLKSCANGSIPDKAPAAKVGIPRHEYNNISFMEFPEQGNNEHSRFVDFCL